MKKYRKREHPKSRQPVFNIITNQAAANYSEKDLEKLRSAIVKSGGRYFLSHPGSAGEMTYVTKRILGRRPTGIIVCGGDGSVSRIARQLIRRTTALGILPMGRFNNIYRSLYGEPDTDNTLEHLFSKRIKKIDYAVASKFFFIGSLAIGLFPEMAEMLKDKKTPRFAIGWSRLAARAASAIELTPLTIKVDAFGFNFAPQTISINLLTHTAGLPISPASAADDGKYEITFDTGPERAIMSGYVRNLFKNKFVYADDIRMFRGEKISISPMAKQRIYIDGELLEFNLPELRVDIYPGRIRLFHKQGEPNR